MIENDKTKANQSIKRRLPLFVVVVFFSFVTLSIVVALGIYQFLPKTQTTTKTKKLDIRFNENRTKESDQALLEKKDYDTYQYSLQFYTDNYLRAKDYKNAERVLNKILASVPEDRIQSGTYVYLNILYKETKNQAKYEQYTKLLIAKLKQEGKMEAVAVYEKELKESKQN